MPSLLSNISFVLGFLILFNLDSCQGQSWRRWRCVEDRDEAKCVLVMTDPEQLAEGDNLLSLDGCKSVCGEYGSLWPQPAKVKLSNNLVDVTMPTEKNLHLANDDDNKVEDDSSTRAKKVKLESFVKEAFNIFLSDVNSSCDGATAKTAWKDSTLTIAVDIRSTDLTLDLDTDESYKLLVASTPSSVSVTISSATYFGARHGLETLSQLLTFDPDRKKLQIVSEVTIEDSPKFRYRGLLLDTGRNYFSVTSIKKIISGLSKDKMNVFHWHMNEQHSFPFVSESEPLMSVYGAYSDKQIYTKSDVEEVVRHALIRGVLVLPEFDAPAHASKGWEWGPEQDKGNLVVCNDDKWASADFEGPRLAAEPNAGQLNPVNPFVYAILENIYKDMFAAFFSKDNPPSIFHMGGDEVNFNCWAKDDGIRKWMREHKYEEDPQVDNRGYLELWGLFQDKAYKRLMNAKQDGSKPLKHGVIIWTSELAKPINIEKHLHRDKYVIQAWFRGSDPWLFELLNRGYRIILSNSDAWYLDCGLDQWTWDGRATDSNWCSPYKGWRTMYENSPRKMVDRFGIPWEEEAKPLVMGGEAPMWSEQVDENGAETRIWPRLSAVAERLWSDPDSGWRKAEARLLQHRHRLVQRGIHADAIMPEYCRQNDGWCDTPSAEGGMRDLSLNNQLLQSMQEQQERDHFAAPEVDDSRGDGTLQEPPAVQVHDQEPKQGQHLPPKSSLDEDIVGGEEEINNFSTAQMQKKNDDVDNIIKKVKLETDEPRSNFGNGGLMAVILVCFVVYLLWLSRRVVLGSVLRLVAVGRKNSRGEFTTGHQA